MYVLYTYTFIYSETVDAVSKKGYNGGKFLVWVFFRFFCYKYSDKDAVES